MNIANVMVTIGSVDTSSEVLFSAEGVSMATIYLRRYRQTLSTVAALEDIIYNIATSPSIN